MLVCLGFESDKLWISGWWSVVGFKIWQAIVQCNAKANRRVAGASPVGLRSSLSARCPVSGRLFTRSLWVSTDGCFYVLYVEPAEVSHKSFKTPTLVLKEKLLTSFGWSIPPPLFEINSLLVSCPHSLDCQVSHPCVGGGAQGEL